MIISFTISWLFMTVYGIAADTLLICLVGDIEVGGGRAKYYDYFYQIGTVQSI